RRAAGAGGRRPPAAVQRRGLHDLLPGVQRLPLPPGRHDRRPRPAAGDRPGVTNVAAHLKTIYPGWWVALGSCLSLGVVAGTTFWAFGLLAGPLEAEFGWSRSAIAAAVSLTLLVSGLASPLVRRLVGRYQ